MWECIASRANLDLPARGDVPRVRVLPGGSALAGLAGALWDGKVPGVAARAPEARVRLLFSDNVHMSDVGRYYMALVHYAVLFGRSPEGAGIPKPLSSKLGRYMQTLAWQFVTTYGQRAKLRRAARHGGVPIFDAERRLPGLCRQGTGILAALKRRFDTNSCRRDYTDARDPDNSFASPRNEKRCRTRV